MRSKECFLSTFTLNPVTWCVRSRHACAGGVQSRRLEPLRLWLLVPDVEVILLLCCWCRCRPRRGPASEETAGRKRKG